MKSEVQRIFLALDLNITGEQRDHPDAHIKEIISTIENIKKKVRNEKSQELAAPISHIIPAANAVPTGGRKTPVPPIGHIFISYSHQQTPRAMQLKELLRERGYAVWFDAEAIKGNSVEAMVCGLNDARLVIMCLSDGYRQSEFCKREAEYTVLKKKPFQPVILQEGFRMENDWLCFVVGLQNWIDLSSDLQFNANRAQFLDHVQHLFANGIASVASTPTSNIAAPTLSTPKPHAPGGLDALDAPKPRSGRPKSGQLPPIDCKANSRDSSGSMEDRTGPQVA